MAKNYFTPKKTPFLADWEFWTKLALLYCLNDELHIILKRGNLKRYEHSRFLNH
mgnify:CR=1 FL=1